MSSQDKILVFERRLRQKIYCIAAHRFSLLNFIVYFLCDLLTWLNDV